MNEKSAKPAPPTIATRVLWFSAPTDIPGKNGASSVTAKKQDNAGSYRLEYIPQMRHHRIAFKHHDRPEEVRYVHECHVRSWEPAE
jgi:hypothetical protein